MLKEIGQDLVTYLQTFVGAGKKLEGIQLVQWTDKNVRTSQHPCITVDWDDRLEPSLTEGRTELRAQFAVTLYTVSLQGEEQAEAENQDFLIRYEGGKWKGLIPVLAGLTTYTDDAGHQFRVTIEGDVRRGLIKSKKHKHWTLSATVLLNFETWLNATEFLA